MIRSVVMAHLAHMLEGGGHGSMYDVRVDRGLNFDKSARNHVKKHGVLVGRGVDAEEHNLQAPAQHQAGDH